MTDGGPSSSSPGDVDRMTGPSFPQTLQTNWRRLSEITLCCSFLSSPCTRIWPSLLGNLENTLKNSFSSAHTYFQAGLERSRSLWTLSAYGVLAARPHWGVQDLSYADSSSRFWQSVTHMVEMWKYIPKDNIKRSYSCRDSSAANDKGWLLTIRSCSLWCKGCSDQTT